MTLRLMDDTKKEEKPTVNQFDGLIHGKDGKKTFPDGKAVGGLDNENHHYKFKGPQADADKNEDPSMVNVIKITESQKNGHGIDKQYPFRGPLRDSEKKANRKEKRVD